MEVRAVTDITEIMRLIPFEVEIAKGEPEGSISIRDRISWIEAEINNRPFVEYYDFKIFIFYENGEIIGYAIASLTKATIKYFNEIRVYRVWYDHEHPECVEEFWKTIKAWAKEHKVHILRADVDSEKLQEHFKEKYKMTPISVLMERRL